MGDHLTEVELLSSINTRPKQGKIESSGLYSIILISAIILYKSTLLLFDIKSI